MPKRELPLAFKQSVWINKIGHRYSGKCEYCMVYLDCFNFYIDYKSGIVDIDKLKVICKICHKNNI